MCVLTRPNAFTQLLDHDRSTHMQHLRNPPHQPIRLSIVESVSEYDQKRQLKTESLAAFPLSYLASLNSKLMTIGYPWFREGSLTNSYSLSECQ